MLTLVLKTAATAIFIVALSEIAKRSPVIAGMLVALPLATAMTMTLMQFDGEGAQKISLFAWSTILFFPPSNVFIVVMWLGMRAGYDFWTTLAAAVVATAAVFWLYTQILAQFGVNLFQS